MTDDKPIRFGARHAVSRLEWEYRKLGAEVSALELLRTKMAMGITSRLIEKHIHKDYIEYEIDVYVATPEQYWAAVKQEALRLTTFRDAWMEDDA